MQCLPAGGATYKGLWTKWYKNLEARKAGWTRKRFKGLDKPAHYVSPTLTYVYGRDYTFKAAGHVSVLTLTGRLVLPYQGLTVDFSIQLSYAFLRNRTFVRDTWRGSRLA